MPVKHGVEVIELALAGQTRDFNQQILAQRTANATVRHLDKLFFRSRQIGAAIAHQGRVDVDLAHVVDDYGDTHFLAIRQNVIQQCRLASTEEAAKHRDR